MSYIDHNSFDLANGLPINNKTFDESKSQTIEISKDMLKLGHNHSKQRQQINKANYAFGGRTQISYSKNMQDFLAGKGTGNIGYPTIDTELQLKNYDEKVFHNIRPNTTQAKGRNVLIRPSYSNEAKVYLLLCIEK